MIKLKVKIDLESFEKLVEEFKEEVVFNGLDKPIDDSLPKLIQELKTLINEFVRAEQLAAQEKVTAEDLDKPKLDIAKSEKTIIEFLSDNKVKYSNYQEAKNFNEISTSNIISPLKNSQGRFANKHYRIDLKVNIGKGDTLQTVRDKFTNYLSNSWLAVRQEDGSTKFFNPVNPTNLAKFIKIKCSSKDGLSENQRFDLDMKEKGYVVATVYQDFVHEIEKNPASKGYVDMTPVIGAIKDGDYDTAVGLLKSDPKAARLTELVENAEKIKENNKLTPDMQAYRNLISGINNLFVKKVRKIDSVRYSLEANTSMVEQEEDVLLKIDNIVGTWLLSEREIWWGKLKIKFKELLQKYRLR